MVQNAQNIEKYMQHEKYSTRYHIELAKQLSSWI